MNHIEDTAECDRRDELLSVLYREANELETAHFHQHLETCVTCQADMRGFGYVRESIGAWKFEALSDVAQSAVTIPTQAPKAKSAVAALREFFDLSPLWLKGATAFAVLLFCLLAVFAFGRFNDQPPATIADNKPGAVYTEQEKDEIVRKALNEHKEALLAKSAPEGAGTAPIKVANSPKRDTARSPQVAKGRRPLTKWEREQLAADLRLLEGGDDDGLELLSDPINW